VGGGQRCSELSQLKGGPSGLSPLRSDASRDDQWYLQGIVGKQLWEAMGPSWKTGKVTA
jgi:hypothetical protein